MGTILLKKHSVWHHGEINNLLNRDQYLTKIYPWSLVHKTIHLDFQTMIHQLLLLISFVFTVPYIREWLFNNGMGVRKVRSVT